MAVSVDVVGKLVNIDVVFKDKNGNAVAAPANSTYTWSVSDGQDYISVVGSSEGNSVGKVTPIAPGTGTVSLTVSSENLTAPLSGTLEITVLSMDPESIELNGTVIDAE